MGRPKIHKKNPYDQRYDPKRYHAWMWRHVYSKKKRKLREKK